MGKPVDQSKLRANFSPDAMRKRLNKDMKTTDGFFDPITWLDSGSYMLNRLISGSFFRGVPLGGVTCFAGESGCLPADAKVRVRLRMKPKT